MIVREELRGGDDIVSGEGSRVRALCSGKGAGAGAAEVKVSLKLTVNRKEW